MAYLILSFMVWISAFTGLPIPDKLPIIYMTTAENIHNKVRPNLEYKEDTAFAILAIYVHDDATIWLDENWDVNSLLDLSILLHEVVHHMQYEAEVSYRCKAELERDAYAAQFAWLAAAGVDPYELVGVNALFLHYVTNCPYRPIQSP
jgi:hypothetical protein